MSVRVMSMVWDSTVPAPERFTLLALADRADEDGKCWPSIGTLAQKCCIGESTVRRHLAALEKLGVIEVQQRFNNTSLYTISLPKLRELAYVPPKRKRSSSTPSQPGTPSQIDRGSRSDTPSQTERTPSQIGRTPPPNLSGPPSQTEHLSISDPSVDPSKNHQGGARERTPPPRRGTRIPDDFTVTPAMVEWARANTPLVGQTETELFIDYWNAESGPKAVKTDWRRAWQVWMRREQKRAEQNARRNNNVHHLRPGPANPTPQGTSSQRAHAILALKKGQPR